MPLRKVSGSRPSRFRDVAPQAVVRDGEIVVRQVMKASLSADHRVTDGAEGGTFLGEIRRVLENPVSLLI